MVETTNVTVKKGSTVDVRVEVEFELQSYTNGKWVKKLGTVIDSNTFPVAPKAGSGQKVLQILTSVINLATKALLTFFKLINQFLTKAN